MSIELGGMKFEGPTAVAEWEPSKGAAVYAIMMKPHPREKPETFLVLYFGQSGNLSGRGFVRSHQKFGCWINKSGSIRNLFVGVLPLPDSTESQRRGIESQLIARYRPDCND